MSPPNLRRCLDIHHTLWRSQKLCSLHLEDEHTSSIIETRSLCVYFILNIAFVVVVYTVVLIFSYWLVYEEDAMLQTFWFTLWLRLLLCGWFSSHWRTVYQHKPWVAYYVTSTMLGFCAADVHVNTTACSSFNILLCLSHPASITGAAWFPTTLHVKIELSQREEEG